MLARLPPAVIVHGQPDVLQCLQIGLPFALLSAPFAGAFGGCGWWRALVAQAGSPIVDILDCGDAPGRAMEALRLGQRWIVLRAPPRVYEDIADRASRCGGRLVAEPPAALDLSLRGAERLLRAHLRRGS